MVQTTQAQAAVHKAAFIQMHSFRCLAYVYSEREDNLWKSKIIFIPPLSRLQDNI